MLLNFEPLATCTFPKQTFAVLNGGLSKVCFSFFVTGSSFRCPRRDLVSKGLSHVLLHGLSGTKKSCTLISSRLWRWMAGWCQRCSFSAASCTFSTALRRLHCPETEAPSATTYRRVKACCSCSHSHRCHPWFCCCLDLISYLHGSYWWLLVVNGGCVPSSKVLPTLLEQFLLLKSNIFLL